MDDLKNVLKENLEYYIDQEKIIVSRLAVLPKGNIKKKTINEDTYYYLQYRKGSKVIDQYVGKEIPDSLEENLKERRQLESELIKVREAIKLLNKKNNNESDFIEPINQILSKFTETGIWESGIEIIGSWCFLLYQKYLPLENYPLRTQDIDILIPLPYKGQAFDFSSYFRKIGFKEHFNPDGSMFFSTPALKVEFLAPQRGKGDKSSQYIKELSISPQLLRYMDMLLKEPFTLQVSRNIRVRLPSPASFFLHKLLISTRVMRKDKQEKDLRQAIYIGKYIIMDSDAREKLIVRWQSSPKTWKAAIKKALRAASSLIPLEVDFIKQMEKVLS